MTNPNPTHKDWTQTVVRDSDGRRRFISQAHSARNADLALDSGDPVRIRETATWLDSRGEPELGDMLRRHALELERIARENPPPSQPPPEPPSVTLDPEIPDLPPPTHREPPTGDPSNG